MTYVVAIADLGSFTKAAERCFVVQSALSHQVARLESELGARLFHRTSRHVRLTSAGEAFLPAARQCIDAAERARAEVAAATGEVRGRLTVGVIPTVAAVDVPRELRRFHAAYPHVRVSLVMGKSDDLTTRVAQSTLDVAFLGLPRAAEVVGVAHRLLQHDRHVAVMSPRHRLATSKRLSLEALADEPFVDFPRGGQGRAQTDEAFAAARLTRDVAFEVSDANLLSGLIREGLGVGLLASSFAARLTGDLAVVPVTGGPSRAEYLIWSRDDVSPATSAFLGQLNEP